MAKTINIAFPSDMVVDVNGRRIGIDEIKSWPTVTHAHLLEYGLRQKTNDGAAMTKEDVGELIGRDLSDYGRDFAKHLSPTELEIFEGAKSEAREARLAMLAVGDLTETRGPRVDPVYKSVLEQFALDYLSKLEESKKITAEKAKATRDKTRPFEMVEKDGKKVKRFTGQSNWSKYLGIYAANESNAAKIAAEVATRKASTATMSVDEDIDLDF